MTRKDDDLVEKMISAWLDEETPTFSNEAAMHKLLAIARPIIEREALEKAAKVADSMFVDFDIDEWLHSTKKALVNKMCGEIATAIRALTPRDEEEPPPMTKIKELVKLLIATANQIEDWNGETMREWDSWRQAILDKKGSEPRDGFEALMADHAEKMREAAAALEDQTARVKEQDARIATLEAQLAAFRSALDNATSRARMNDSDGAQVSVDNFHLKNGRVLLSALRNAETKDG